jgi:hypothetical protein
VISLDLFIISKNSLENQSRATFQVLPAIFHEEKHCYSVLGQLSDRQEEDGESRFRDNAKRVS